MSDDLLPYKGSIINEMYLHTADENYITARWCHDQQLWTDFFWNSVHALEKYMKAVLLFNGISVKKEGHGLASLYEKVERLAGALLPTLLTQPPDLDIYHWVNRTPMEFMKTLDDNGNADNRYLTYGYSVHAWYIHMVDAMVWHIRRLALPLDTPLFSQTNATRPTHRQILTNQPNWVDNQMLALERTIAADGTQAQRALLNNNCAFAPDTFQHEPQRQGASSRNPVLLRRILDPLDSSIEDNARHGYEMGTWLLANTKQSKAVSDEIKNAMAAALAKHPGIDKPKP